MYQKTNILTGWTRAVRSKILFLFVGALLLVSFSTTIGGGIAHASSRSFSTGHQQTIGLTVDCAKLSASVLRKAIQQNLCALSGKNSVTPFNTRYGNCGITSLYITDNFNGGYPTITIGADSFKGYMVYIGWHVKYQNLDTGEYSGYGGSQAYFGDNWSRSDNPPTGTGDIQAVLDNLRVVTAEGYSCYGLQPSDIQVVD